MNLLLVSDAYPPEIRSASELMRELAVELCARHHRVVVLTSYPRHNLTAEAAGRDFARVTDEAGVTVIRVPSPAHHKVGKVRRGVAELLLRHNFSLALRRFVRPPIDAVLVYSPPLTLAHVGARARGRFAAHFVLNAQDLFPQNAIDLGVLRSPLLIGHFRRMEQRAYAAANAIVVHSDGNRATLVSDRSVAADKVHVVHNWIDVDRFASGTGSYRQRYGLDGKFIVLFAGVIGPSQGLDLVLAAADRLRHRTELVFLLVGDGTERERLQAEAIRRELFNVVFKPFVSAEEYPELVSSVDVGLVCLSPRNRTSVVPAKVLGYMAGGLPVIAALQASSDAHSMIAASGGGLSAVSDSPDKLIAMVEAIMDNDQRPALGRRGRRFVAEHYARAVCVDQLEAALRPC